MSLMLLVASLVSPDNVPPTGQAAPRFHVIGTAIDSPDAEMVNISFSRTPLASDFPHVDWARVPHEATVSANCTAKGTRLNCRITERLPNELTFDPVYLKALQTLVMQPETSTRVRDRKFIFVYLRLTNPDGLYKNRSFCDSPFCSVVPPPPPPGRNADDSSACSPRPAGSEMISDGRPSSRQGSG